MPTCFVEPVANGIQQPPIPPLAIASAEQPDEDPILKILHKYDIDMLYWKNFYDFADTLVVNGAEFRSRVLILEQFQAALKEIRELKQPTFTDREGVTHRYEL